MRDALPQPPRGRSPMRIRIVVADAHAIVRAGIRTLCNRERDLLVVGEAATAAEAVAAARELRPDVLLMSVGLTGSSGLEAVPALREIAGVKVLLLTEEGNAADIVSALEHGACGVISADGASSLLPKSVRAVTRGEYWVSRGVVGELVHRLIRAARPQAPRSLRTYTLTPRERQIVAAIVEGCSNREIAVKFGLSGDTVKHHLTNIFQKTSTSNRLELAVHAVAQATPSIASAPIASPTKLSSLKHPAGRTR